MPFETIAIGLVVALLYIEITGLYPGGIIVPAFMALTLDHPGRTLATLLIACVSLLIYKFFARYFLLFGRRRFVLILLLGVFLSQLWSILLPSFSAAPLELRAIGWIIPGLLANNLERQEFLPTMASLTTVVVITYFLSALLRLAG